MKLNTKDKRADYYEVLDFQQRTWVEGKLNNINRKILTEKNIICAYDILKRNKGSKTAGVDNLTIDDLNCLTTEEIINTVRKCLEIIDHSKLEGFIFRKQMERLDRWGFRVYGIDYYNNVLSKQ